MPQCKLCDFTCKYESNYKSHLNSKKHKEKLESKNLCDGCFKEFSTKSNKYRHEKKCGVMQTINNIHTQNNIGTQNNTTNNIVNIILPDNPESTKVFMQELRNSPFTDCFQKKVLDDMTSNNYDLMDYIEKFDKKLNETHEDMMNEHNMNCKTTSYVDKIDNDGEKYIEKIVYTPLSHPEYKFECKHEDVDFKLNEDIVSKILSETLLDDNDKIVVTHNNDINGMTDLLFKHNNILHTDEILLQFLSKSNRKDLCNLSEDFKPATKIKHEYPEYYSKLEDKAIKILTAYNRKVKFNRL